MEVKMKVAFLCCVLLLAGSASSSPVEANNIKLIDINIPDWILDLVSGLEIPDAIQNIIDKLPEIIAAIPDIIDRLPEIIAQIVEKIPKVIDAIIDKLPEIIAQIPELADRVREILQGVIDRIPEVIPIILEKIPQIFEAIPGIFEQVQEIYNSIREILEGLELPDWFPNLPDLEAPEWWPIELPEIELPEFNRATPGIQTSVSEYPGIVQIEIGTGPIWAQGCVGSVLTSFHVLSAARCFSGNRYNDRFRRVVAGSSTRYERGYIAPVARAITHPDFGRDSFDADIAVIRLASSLVLGANIQQTAIVPQGFSVPAGLGVTLVGWGSTAEGKLLEDRNLYQVGLSVIDNNACANSWSRIPPITITANMVCVGEAQYGGRNGDVRDLGAPMYYQGILFGVQTCSANIGNQLFPVGGTAVGSYTNWIIANAV